MTTSCVRLPGILLLLAAGTLPSPASAAARIAESGRYICVDGSEVVLDRRGYGPTLLRGGGEVRLVNRWVLSGFRFTGVGVNIRGRGVGSGKLVILTEAGHAPVECPAAPAGATPGIVTGRLSAADAIRIPNGARVMVQLRDAARMDVAAPLLGQVAMRPDRHQLPLAFLLRYPADTIAPPARPAMSARILDASGTLIAISDTFTPLPLPSGGRNRDVEIWLRAVPGRSSR